MQTLRYFVIELASSFVSWPAWWYTNGFVYMAKARFASVQNYAKSVALGVWVKNLFVPMFGRRDWQSRLISFFMRLFQICLRGFMVFVWATINLLLFVVYALTPIVALVFAIFHLIGPLVV